MLRPPLTPAPVVQDWLLRHGRPVNFALHMVGIPPTLVGALMLPIAVAALSPAILGFALALFVVGYMIQFLGHALDGTEPGEVTYLRRKVTRALRKRLRKAVASGRRPGPVA